MKNCYIDANVLVYYQNEESPSFDTASNLIKNLTERDFQLFISPLVLDEFLHAFNLLFHHKKIKKSETSSLLSKALREIFTLPNLTIVGTPLRKSAQLEIVSLMEKFKLRPRDAYHLLTIQEHHITHLATFDQDFQVVFRQKVVLPFKH